MNGDVAVQDSTTWEDSLRPAVVRPSLSWTSIDELATYGLADWQVGAILGVSRLSSLEHNWDTYGSPPISDEIRERSINLIKSLPILGIPTPHVVPVAGGRIQFEWSIGNKELEIEIGESGEVEFLKSQLGEPLEEGELRKDHSHLQSLVLWLLENESVL